MLLYPDPSGGGLLLQVVLGGAAGGLVIVKIFWQRVALFGAVIKGRILGRMNPKE